MYEENLALLSHPADSGCDLLDMANIQPYNTNDDDFDYDPESEFERLEEVLEHQMNDLCADPKEPRVGQGPEVYIGFDSEFVPGKKVEGKTGPNTVLSLQFYLVGERGSLSRVVYPSGESRSDRPSFYLTISSLINEALETGVILEWPKRVVICGFFLRLDLPAFGDLVTFKRNLDTAGGRVSSVNSGVNFEAKFVIEEDPEDLERLLKNKSYVAIGPDGITRLLLVSFVDVGSHVAVGTSIADMGDLIGLPKLLIPEGHSIERMDLLLEGDKTAFEAYGLRDAEIAVRYFQRLLDFAETHTGSRSLPVTASGLAVKIFKKQLRSAGTSFNDAFGVKETTYTCWNADKGHVVTPKKISPTDMRKIIEPFVSSCYSGGRNECYAFGPSVTGVWNDFDLAGAYTTGLVDLRHIDYENFRVTHDLNDFIGHVLGFAYVDFSFPAETRFPSLPVRGKNDGLFYPLTGTSYCTAPEIEVALSLGCDIKIKHGLVIPWLEGDDRLFEPYVAGIRKLRKSLAKGSIDELYAKLLGNSLYGKTAQGLKKKTVFDTRGMKSVELPHSELTNAAIAAHTTGFIRALLSELIAGVPNHRKVLSATTDGFITDAVDTELDLAGTMALRFKALCHRVAPDSPMLELKHRVRQLVAMKTRGQITGLAHSDYKLILAKAGVSPPVPADQHNEYMLKLFLDRVPEQKTETRPFTPIRDQWNKDLDVVRSTREILLNLEFDFKRRLCDPVIVAVNNADLGINACHVSLGSRPWNSIDEAERARAVFDGWRRERCLKTLDDWLDWDNHFQFVLARDRLKSTGKSAGIRDTGNGSVDIFRRLFLRAYSQELCGLNKSMSYSELAQWLTHQGYITTVDELKNAKRSKFIENVIPHTDRMRQFASLLYNRFPDIEINKFFENNL